jgi:hypothetical protein
MNAFVPYPSIETVESIKNRKWDKEENNYKFYIEEKIDGSQLSFLLNEGKLVFYNKSNKIKEGTNIFDKALTMLRFAFNDKNLLNNDLIYHGEAVCNLKHNCVLYNRTPKYYFILYDIYNVPERKYMSPEFKQEEAKRLNLECVPIIYYNDDVNCNVIEKCEQLITDIIENKLESCLGGIPEGIVLKHHAFNKGGGEITATKKKMVTDKFKERLSHKQEKMVYSADDFIKRVGLSFAVHARYHKAVQHLLEKDLLIKDKITGNDIHKVTEELNSDFDKEYKEEMMMLLWTEMSPHIKKYAREGLGQWFRETIVDNKQQ